MIDADARFENVHILGDYNLLLIMHNGIIAENSTLDFLQGRILEIQDKAIQLINSTAEVSNAKLSASLIHVEVENGSSLDISNSQLTGYGDGGSVLKLVALPIWLQTGLKITGLRLETMAGY
jgi:hypothetical protein